MALLLLSSEYVIVFFILGIKIPFLISILKGIKLILLTGTEETSKLPPIPYKY